MHSTKPAYDGQKYLEDCEVTCGKCYPDGTSLGATEDLGYVDPENKYHEEMIWLVLYDWFRSRFKEIDDE